MDETIKELIKIIIITSICIFLISFFNTINKGEECVYSQYNTYSNSTEGYFRFFNKCYVTINIVYESTERCGFLGFSCYKTEPETKMYNVKVCFNLKNGKKC